MMTPQAATARDLITKFLATGTRPTHPERMMLAYDATWDCERSSDTQYDCPHAPADVEWCRSCIARKALKEEEN